ncbi:MAG: MFS transporter [Deltaproteobacteria bacterium]|nr:MFS transporter [Deltaproteobacteria bacterium]
MINNYSESKYRWYVLSLAALTMTFCMCVPHICMPVLFNEISTDLGLDLVQVGWIWGFSFASGLFTVLISGLMADRFSAKRILIVICTLAGLSGASRGLANDFAGLLFTTFLFSFITGAITSTLFKVIATWFSSRQLGLAIGIMLAGGGVGFTIGSMFSATLMSPMLGSWRRVLFLYGGISVFIALLWFITIKEQQTAGGIKSGDRAKLREAIYHVSRNKNVLLISFAMLGYMGCAEGMSGYLPIYLREFKGWLPASADGTLAAFMGFSTLGAVPISLLSDKLGRRKFLILLIMAITIIGLGLLSVADGIIIWILIIIIGFGRDGLVALACTSNIESNGIGVVYSGTAMGFMQTILRIGAFISPPIGNSMAASGAGLPFIVWAGFGAFALVCFSLIRETGRRQK